MFPRYKHTQTKKSFYSINIDMIIIIHDADSYIDSLQQKCH